MSLSKWLLSLKVFLTKGKRWVTEKWLSFTIDKLPLPFVKAKGFQLFVMPANNGDSLLIVFEGEDGEDHHIWIDGGLVSSYKTTGKHILEMLHQEGNVIDLMMVTHIDQDHIGGILAFMRDEEADKKNIHQFWFNSGKLIAKHFDYTFDRARAVGLEGNNSHQTRSISQGKCLEDLLEEMGIWHEQPLLRFQTYELYGAAITILSPDENGLKELYEKWSEGEVTTRGLNNDYTYTIEELAKKSEKEDHSVANGSSISFVFELGKKRLLMLGDAHPSLISDSLKLLGYSPNAPLQLDCVKLSHHASKASISYELLSLIDCQYFVISTDGSRHHLPNKEALSRILLDPHRHPKAPIEFIFNYNNETLAQIFEEEEMVQYNFSCRFPPPDAPGIVFED